MKVNVTKEHFLRYCNLTRPVHKYTLKKRRKEKELELKTIKNLSKMN